MPEVKHVSDSIAEIYARSLLDLAAEQGVADDIGEEFSSLIDYMAQDPDFARFLTGPSVDDDARRRSLDRIFQGKMSDLLLGTLHVLNSRSRCELVPAVHEQYQHLLEELRGQVDVYVTSAVPLSEQLTTQLQQQISAYIEKQAVLVVEVDPDILGGLVVRIGDRQIDASVKSRIDGLRRAFRERASREIHAGKHRLDPASEP